MNKSVKKAIFLDKDGTLITNQPYNVNCSTIVVEQETIEGLKHLSAKGYNLIVVTNQSGIARGLFDETAVENVKNHLKDILHQQMINLDGFYYCPHLPSGKVPKYAVECECRKPKAGLILQSADDLNINLSESWVIGDSGSDIEAGFFAGCRTILLGRNLKGRITRTKPDFYASDFSSAVTIIVSEKKTN